MNFETAIYKASVELKKNNIKSHLLDSEILMSKAINRDREFVILNLDKDLSKNCYYHFKKLINQRSNGKPVAYLIGKKSFWKHEFYINENDKCLKIIDNAQKFVSQFKDVKQERLIQLLILKQYFKSTGQYE